MSLKKIVTKPPEPEEEPSESLKTSKHQSIPPSVFYNSNLKKMGGFKNLRSNMKRESFLKEFVTQGLSVFEAYIVDEDTKYDTDIVKFMCQSAEDTFIHYNKQGVEKRLAVVQICKKYFDNNELLVEKLIEQVLPGINKSSFLRRNRTRLYNVGLFFLGLFLNKPSKH